jgi:hypothetical protein
VKGFGPVASLGNMNTSIGRETVRLSLGLAAIVAMVGFQAGCDTRHFLGTVDAGPGAPGSGGTVAIGSGGAPSTGSGGGGATGNRDAEAAGTGGVPNLPPHDASGTVLTDAGPSAPDVGVLGASQSWTGYVENYQFPSGSDLINLTFASDAAGHMVGTVILGSGTPPPPAIDPNVGYPTGYGDNTPGVASNSYVAEGFAYPMASAIGTPDRMRFEVHLTDLWRGWCALQTPVFSGTPNYYRCLPSWSGLESANTCSLTDPATNQSVPVDCGKFILCASTCSCTSSACVPNEDLEDLSFDLSLTDTRSDGSVVGYLGSHNVHLTRVMQDR